jgi:hypothetical protein
MLLNKPMHATCETRARDGQRMALAGETKKSNA